MATDPLAFDTEKCPIDPVVRIPPCDTLLVDVRISDPPQDMPDCPAEPLTLDPEPPCPVITPDSSLPSSAPPGWFGGTYEENPPNFVFKFTKGACCEFDLDIDINIPCPKLLPPEEAPEEKEPPFVETPNKLTYFFTKNLDTCEFDLDIEIDIHCPNILPQVAAPDEKEPPFVEGPSTLVYSFTKNEDACDYDFDIEIEIHCPALTPLAASPDTPTVTFVDGPTVLTYFFAKTAESCDYDLDIDIDLHCPTFTPTHTSPEIKSFGGGAGTLTYYVTRTLASCDFDLFIDIDFDGGCPVMLPGSATFVYGYVGYSGVQTYISYAFTKHPTECEWTLDIDFVVACPSMLPTSATFVYGYYGYGGEQSYVSYQFTKGADCEWTLEIDFVVACPSMLPTSATYVYGYIGYGGVQSYVAYVFTKGSDCEWTLEIDFVSTCPYMQPETVTYVYGYTANGVQSYIGWYFTKGSNCDWTLTLEYLQVCPYLYPQTVSYVYLYTAQGVQGYISWYFIRDDPFCDYQLVIDAVVACPYIRPQAPTYYTWTWPNGQQGEIQWNFVKHATECQYTLFITTAVPCPVVTHTFDYGLHKIACSKAGSMSFGVAIDPLNCLNWHWYLHLWVPGGCGAQVNCTTDCPPAPAEAMRLAPDALDAPIAAIPSSDPDLFTYAAAVPVYMPDSRVEEVVVVRGPWEPGEAAVARTPIDAGFLSMVADGTLEVVGLVCDRPAVAGAWVEGGEVLVALTPGAAPVEKVVLRLSGRNRNKPGRYSTLSDKQLLEIELAEARKAEAGYAY